MATQSATSKSNGSSKGDDVSVEDLKKDFDQLKSDMSSLVQQMKEMSKAKAGEKVDEARDAARTAGENVQKRATEGYATGRAWFAEQATERPQATAGALLAAGYVIGRMMRR